jgi:hypothetical protein
MSSRTNAKNTMSALPRDKSPEYNNEKHVEYIRVA